MKTFSVKLESLIPKLEINDLKITLFKNKPLIVSSEQAKNSKDILTLVNKGLLNTQTLLNIQRADLVKIPVLKPQERHVVPKPVFTPVPVPPVLEDLTVVAPVPELVEAPALEAPVVEVPVESQDEVLDLFDDSVLEALSSEASENKNKKNRKK
jgi:hypothetical protein